MKKTIICTVAVAMLTACSTKTLPPNQPTADRVFEAQRLASTQNWTGEQVKTMFYPLQSYGPKVTGPVDTLTIYIEGDGEAYSAGNDPTPTNPVALKLALRDTGPAVYLGRPCQYIKSNNCTPEAWTNARYSQEMVNSTNEAITKLKLKYGAKNIRLVGYSGGATIALLTAAQRNSRDITSIITVAGLTSVGYWTKYQALPKLTASLDPVNYVPQLSNIPTTQLIGSKDKVIPVDIAEDYTKRFPSNRAPTIMVIDGMSHAFGWDNSWATILAKVNQNNT